MSSYQALASCYDQLTKDVDYTVWANYLHRQFLEQELTGNMILDLGCGTGSLTLALAQLGYEMIGVDSSEDMLMVAQEKAYDFDGQRPLFLCQSMEKLDLFGTIDGCVSCLDSINYITKPEQLLLAFQRVFLFLMPGGTFLFDIKTGSAFAKQQDALSIDEGDDVFCVWRTEVNTEKQSVEHAMDLFLKEGNFWKREQEIHHQKIYETEALEDLLQQAGFVGIKQFGNLSLLPPSVEEERIFFLAKKPLDSTSS